MPWDVQGRMLVYAIIYSLGATRCIILHLATSESLQHAIGGEDGSLMLCGLIVAFVSLALVQVKLSCTPSSQLTSPLKSCENTSTSSDIGQSLTWGQRMCFARVKTGVALAELHCQG